MPEFAAGCADAVEDRALMTTNVARCRLARAMLRERIVQAVMSGRSTTHQHW